MGGMRGMGVQGERIGGKGKTGRVGATVGG